MADNSSVEQQTQEIENKNDTDEPKEPTAEQTEEIPPEKVAVQFFLTFNACTLCEIVYIFYPILLCFCIMYRKFKRI
jgi:hypothetical protein